MTADDWPQPAEDDSETPGQRFAREQQKTRAMYERSQKREWSEPEHLAELALVFEATEGSTAERLAAVIQALRLT